MPVFNTYPNRAELMASLADRVAEDLAICLGEKDRATLVVPGGSTPGPFFDHLSEFELNWERVDVILSDERFVPPTHPRSNTKLVMERLCKGNAQGVKIVPFYISADRPEDVLAEISVGISRVLPIDVLILGMGLDMHTASLFPDAKELSHALTTSDPVVIIHTESQPEARLSLTKSALQSANKSYVLIVGEDKKIVMQDALFGDDIKEAPIRLVFEKEKKAEVFYAP